MHTNATISLSDNDTTATLSLGGQSLIATLRQPSGGDVKFEVEEPVRLSTDPALPSGQVDQPNPGVSVLVIKCDAGSNVIEVLFK